MTIPAHYAQPQTEVICLPNQNFGNSTLTFNYPNVGALADYLAKEVLSLQPPAVPAAIANPETPTTMPSESGQLSEDELATRLAERLAQIR